MSAVAGYQINFKHSGSSTGFSGESMTATTGNTWKITDDLKNVLDREVTPNFYDNGVAIPSVDIDSIDYMYGKVTFTTTKTGPITIDGAYMPLLNVGCAKEGSLTLTSAIHDDTCTGNVGYHTKKYGKHDVNVSISRFDDVLYVFPAILNAREPIVIEVAPSPDKTYRGWFVMESDNSNLDINALLEESLSFQLSGGTEKGKSFSISSL